MSYTLWLSPPESYDGGELCLGEKARLKENAGTIVLYDSGTPHSVLTVREGSRVVAVGWLQSMVRAPQDRSLLRRFYSSLRSLKEVAGGTDAFQELHAVRNELARRWLEP